MNTQPSASLSQLRWHCRRGMLELDILLNEYLDAYLQQSELGALDQQQLALFDSLLDYPDAVLLDLLMGNVESSDPVLARFIRRLRQKK